MRLRVVLVRTEYGGNIGYAARAMRNFGFSDLALVEPKADHKSGLAKSRAMRGRGLLERAKVMGTLSEALDGADFSAATTCRATGGEKLTRTAIPLHEFAKNHAKTGSKVAVVFGPERNGLTNSEIALCDFVVEIPASREYPTLSLGHAVAVVLYEVCQASVPGRAGRKFQVLSGREKEQVIKKFNDLIHAGSKIRDKAGVLAAFRALLSRSPATGKEGRAMMGVFDSALRGLEAKNKKNQ